MNFHQIAPLSIPLAKDFCTKITAPSCNVVISEVTGFCYFTTNATLVDEPFTIEELTMVLENLNLSSSASADGTTYVALCRLGMKTPQPPLYVYNESWQRGHLDPSWKIPRIVSVLKPGEPATDLYLYRPITFHF